MKTKELTSIILPPYSACLIEIKGDRSILDENRTDEPQKISVEMLGGETLSIIRIKNKGLKNG